MKEYERQVIWLDYFNSELKRREGRRVPMNSATRSPTLDELGEACRRLKLESVAQPAQFPLSPLRQSGYVSVPKSKPKQGLVMTIAKELSVVRGLAQKKQQQQQQQQHRKQPGRAH